MDERGLEMFQIFHLCFAWHKKVIEADGWCLSALDYIESHVILIKGHILNKMAENNQSWSSV